MTTNFTAKCLAVQTYGGYTAGTTYTLSESVYGPLVAQGVLRVIDGPMYQSPQSYINDNNGWQKTASYALDASGNVAGLVGPDGSTKLLGTVGTTAALDAQTGVNVNRLDPLRPDTVAVSATGMVKCNAGYFLGFRVISASGLTVAFADQSSPTAQRAIATYAGLSAGDEVTFPGSGYPLINGLYATFTGTGVLSVKVA